MGQRTRLSLEALKILATFLAEPAKELTGADIIRTTRIASGTLYPILLRFEKLQLLTSRWEAGNPVDLRHPRRRYYRVSPEGAVVARRELGSLLRPAAPAFAEVDLKKL